MNVAMTDEYPQSNFDREARVKVCGIGGGGGNAVGRMIEAGMSDVDFITINTDAQALRHSKASTRLQIGETGLGAGAFPDVARQAADKDRDRIQEILQDADMIFLTAGMGGGTGTGAGPVVAEVAKETGALTVAVITLPFAFEGGERMKNALMGLEQLQKHVDAAVVVPNDRLSILCQTNISFTNAFNLADEVLHNGVRAICDLITIPGMVNLDFADVCTTLRGSGRALMGIASAEGDDRAVKAAEEAVVCPLLENSTIEGATRVIVNIHGGQDIGMREVHDAMATVQKGADPAANIIFGAVVDSEHRDDITVTVIAAGFPKPQEDVKPFTQQDAASPVELRSIEKTLAQAEAHQAPEMPALAEGPDPAQTERPSPTPAPEQAPKTVAETPAPAAAAPYNMPEIPDDTEEESLTFAADSDTEPNTVDDAPTAPPQGDSPIQLVLPEDERKDSPFPEIPGNTATQSSDDRDEFDIPAFMRRRIKRAQGS